MSHDEVFSADEPYAERRSSGGCAIASIVAGLVVGVGLLTIASCCGVVYFAMDGIVGPQIVEDLRDNPVVDEHVGAITDSDFVFGLSFMADEDDYVIDVTGTKGTGRLRVTAVEQGDQYDVLSGTLETPDGIEHDLFPHEDGEGEM